MAQYVTTRQFATRARQYEVGEPVDGANLGDDERLAGLRVGALTPVRWTGTAAQLAARGGVPGAGVLVQETDTGVVRLGDGSSSLADAPQVGGPTARAPYSQVSRSWSGVSRGAIGTSGRGVLAFRFDHHVTSLRTLVWPLFKARYLPGALSLHTEAFTREATSAGTTWANITTLVKEGMEIWAHSCTHRDPQGTDTRGLYGEIVDARRELEAQGLVVQGMTLPGTSGTTPAGRLPYGADFTTFRGWDSPAGRLMMETYPIAEADAAGWMRALPTGPGYGWGHVTMDAASIGSLRSILKYVEKHHVGAEFMLHSGLVDTPGYITLADLTAFLDEVAASRDAGKIEVLTQSGLYYADPGSSNRLDLVSDGSFVGLVPGVDMGQWTASSWTGITVSNTGGRTTGYLRLTGVATEVVHSFLYCDNMALGGAVVVGEGWCRATGSDATARITIKDQTVGAPSFTLGTTDQLVPADGSWHRVRVMVGLPGTVQEISPKISRVSGGTLDWCDVTCHRM